MDLQQNHNSPIKPLRAYMDLQCLVYICPHSEICLILDSRKELITIKYNISSFT